MKMLKKATTCCMVVLGLLMLMGQGCPEDGAPPDAQQEFEEITVPLKDDDGTKVGTVVIDEKGIQVLDADGNVVSAVSQAGSTHNVPETFTQITVPLKDGSGNQTGTVVIGKTGVSLSDKDFAPLYLGPGELYDIDVDDLSANQIAVTDLSADGITVDNLVAEKITAEVMDPLVLESFPVSPEESYEPGDVLVIDAHGSGTVCLSYEAEDTGVLGVVGPRAVVDESGEILATILGAHGPLRKTGTRLASYVKADATYGAIEAGDLLTTSPTPGHAMKAGEPKTGTILGKALEPLAQGRGLIKVFVTVQ